MIESKSVDRPYLVILPTHCALFLQQGTTIRIFGASVAFATRTEPAIDLEGE
jgi:hypothetical protein